MTPARQSALTLAATFGITHSFLVPRIDAREADACEAMLVSLRRFFFALGDQERLGGVGQCCDGARREVGLIRLALRGLILDRFAVVLALAECRA